MQSSEENQLSIRQPPAAARGTPFVAQARALPGVLEAHERLRDAPCVGSSDEKIDVAGEFSSRRPDVDRVVVMDDHVIAGALLYDDDSHALDPLEEGRANGMIYHCGGRRSRDGDERAAFFAALGRDAEGGRDLTAEGAIEEFIRHATEGLRSNRAVMSILSHQLRAQGKPGSWDTVLKLIEETIRQDGGWGDVVFNHIAQRFFGVPSWDKLPSGMPSRLEGLAVLLTATAASEAWERAVQAGTVGNPLAVLLDIYEHGGILYSVSGEGMQCRWDTSRGAAIWVPDKDAEENILANALAALGLGQVRWFGALGSDEDPLHARYSLDGGASWHGHFAKWADALNALAAASPVKPNRETLEATLREQSERYCRGVLEEFNAWVNGEVYVAQVKVFDRRTGEELVEHEDICGGYIGMRCAEESLEETVLEIASDLLGAKAN